MNAAINDVQKIERDQLIVDNLIFRGGYSKPNIKDILWIQLILSPYYLVQYIIWFGRWVWKFWICREEYGEEEKLYLIKKYLKASRSQWEVGVAGYRTLFLNI